MLKGANMSAGNYKPIDIEPGQEWDTIAIFEQILETKPQDLPALDVLARAYEAIGDISKSCQFGIKLAEASLAAKDLDFMKVAHKILQPHVTYSADTAVCVQNLVDGMLKATSAPVVAEAPPAGNKEPTPPSPVARLRVIQRDSAVNVPASNAIDSENNQPANETGKNKRLRLVSRPTTANESDQSPSAISATPTETTPTKLRGIRKKTPVQRKRINPMADPGRRRTIVAEEIDMAWDLQQAGLITEDNYAAVVRDLTELSSSDVPVTISALHLLQFRDFANTDQIMVYLSEKSGIPIIPLASFDPQPAAFGSLPLSYMTVQGAIPFECVADELLVTVLNPLNARIQHEIRELTGTNCHFYLASPADFDTIMEIVKSRYQSASAQYQQHEAAGSGG